MRSLSCFLILLLAVALWGCSGDGAAPLVESEVAFPPARAPGVTVSGLAIGPIEGLTTAWHAAPSQTPIPTGTVVRMRCAVPEKATIAWHGAAEYSRAGGFSYAECPVSSSQRMTVRVDVMHDNGRIETHTCNLRGVDVAVADIRASGVRIVATTVELHDGMTNEETMKYFFGSSIAPLEETAEGHYRTSVGRQLTLVARADPPAFAPLIEWSTNGQAFLLGAEQPHRFDAVGRRVLEAGPPGRSGRITVDTYSVRIVNGVTNGDKLYESVATTFTARTTPPGLKDEIVWLASTKYGEGLPAVGRGGEFTVIFDHTYGMDGVQWLGVRASNATFAQDGASSLSICGDILVQAFRDVAGRPIPDNVPNGANEIGPIPLGESATDICPPIAAPPVSLSTLPGQTVTNEYTVTGANLPAVNTAIFDAATGAGFLEGGTRYAGQCTTEYLADWNSVSYNQQTNKFTGQITGIDWTNTIDVPTWTPPGGTPAAQVNEWNRFRGALDTHEQGHATIADTQFGLMETALVNQAAGRFCVNIPRAPAFTDGHPSTAADSAIVNTIGNAMRAHIEARAEYGAVDTMNDAYDAPPTPQNPGGTNHGATQNATLDPNP